MNRVAKKKLVVEIQKLALPIDYKLEYYDEETDEITDGIIGHVIYVHLMITDCSKLKKPYKTSVYFNFDDSYPFVPPAIMLEDVLIHELVDDDIVLLCDYCPAMNFGQLILNAYCIILEGLESDSNKDLVDIINK